MEVGVLFIVVSARTAWNTSVVDEAAYVEPLVKLMSDQTTLPAIHTCNNMTNRLAKNLLVCLVNGC